MIALNSDQSCVNLWRPNNVFESIRGYKNTSSTIYLLIALFLNLLGDDCNVCPNKSPYTLKIIVLKRNIPRRIERLIDVDKRVCHDIVHEYVSL